MGLIHWKLLFVILCACNRVTWSLYRRLPQQSELWSAAYYISQNQTDCNAPEKYEEFPELFDLQNDSDTFIGPPVNMTTSYIFKRYRRRGRRYYPGITINFEPPDCGREHVRGYELSLIKPDGVLCLVIKLNIDSHPESQEEKISIELFPLSDRTLFQIQSISLPQYSAGQQTNMTKIMTGHADFLRDPVSWDPAVTSEITRRGNERWLDIIFSSPPPQFRFRRFEIALLPASEEGQDGVELVTTNKCSHVFTNVAPGVYKLQIRPVDDYFSHQGQCLCHYPSGACTTCTTIKVQAFTVA